ncbi:alkaline phosphatase family protein [Streptomyces sp. NPDC090052]|uniref:alkaline phosphatase family protein n=1 Tax=Streptomyces sp. NPDC090052 TaxID=3365931 RepID=UPI0038183616
MSEINRRRFLQLAGATAGLSALSQSIDRAAAIPARRHHGTLRDVEHIVVLMQENRSFDHYFGALRGVRGFGDPRPFPQSNGKSVWYQSDGTKDVLRHDAAHGGGLELVLANPADSPTTLSVTDAYRGGAITRLTVPARGRLRHRVSATGGHRWYDLTLRVPGDPHYLRRLAGHIETREEGLSDPGTVSS